MAEVGNIEVARDPEVRALRAANKRLTQELGIKKDLGHLRLTGLMSIYHYVSQRVSQVPVR